MKPKGKSCFRLKIHFFFLFAIILFTPALGSSEETYKFERMWPTLQQPWYFHYPCDLAINNEFVYVADSMNHRIQKFTSDGQFVTKWGRQGSGDGEFSSPYGIAISDDGYIYVFDLMNHRIQKFTSDGQFVSKWGSFGDGDGEFQSVGNVGVCGVAIDSNNFVYVVDKGNNRIQKFTSDGQFVSKWGSFGDGDGEFDQPSDITIDSSRFIYVTDTGNNRIQKFTSNGQFVSKWIDSVSNPSGITVDNDDFVYIADAIYAHYGRIQKFTTDGHFVSKCADYYQQPQGITVDNKGFIYLACFGRVSIYKITSNGKLLSSWGSSGSGQIMFYWPRGIAVDSNEFVYVSDGSDVQKFTSDGQFVTKWGSGDGKTGDNSGIAIDSNNFIYVADGLNHRIQKFSSDGEFITTWGSKGDGDGEFGSTDSRSKDLEYIAIDNSGFIYAVDEANFRIQKFTSDGQFVTKWGRQGSGDGEFSSPYGIAIDSSGFVHIADNGNRCIQKFTSDGQFVSKWGKYSSDGYVKDLYPRAIAIDDNDFIYVNDEVEYSTKKFTLGGNLITEFGEFGSGIGQRQSRNWLAINATNGKLYFSDTYNNRIQVFRPISMNANNKAIVVSGGGPFSGNNLWDATQMCANFAYRTLTYQGFTKESICYLTSDTDLDLDSNGVLDDVDGDATNGNLQQAITTWAKDADSLVLYLADHGGSGTFRMSGTETLSASDIDAWLDTLQSTISGKVTVIYDACESGSFLSSLTPPSGRDRVVITSTSPGESAKFVTQGSVSFSNYFWTHILNGVNVKDSFVLTKNALAISFDDQTPLLDANGNGAGNEPQDFTLVLDSYIGNGTVISGDAPAIGSVSPEQTITGTSSAKIYAASVTDNDGIARVWAVIRSPDYNQGSADNPVTSLPSIDLLPVGGDQYEATYEAFNIAGTYQVAIYARDRIGNTSIPKLTTVSVNSPLRRRAIIVAGGPQTDPLWSAIQKNAGLAYEALTFQGYTNDDIYFMSPVTFSAGVDGLPTLSNIQYAATTWAKTNTQDIVLYLLGNGGNGTFKVNETESLPGTDLDTWLDSLQTSIPGKVTVIYEACRSGSFLPLLTPPSGKERILISSASGYEPTYFLSGGDICFSKFFWSQVANGSNLREAFLHGKDAIKYSCKGQTPQMDDNGNGTGNEKSDGILSRRYTIGFGIMLGGDDPIIGSVNPTQTLAGETSATLWADQVTSTNSISKVWAIIIPPDNSSDPSKPITDLPMVTLTDSGAGNYRGTYTDFSSEGTYAVTVYAMDQDGNVSVGKETSILQTSGRPPCSDCGGDDVTISNREFGSDTNCECTATHSITLGDGVKIKQGATMIFKIEK